MNRRINDGIFNMLVVILCMMIIQRFSVDGKYYPVIDDWFLYGDIYENKLTDFIIPNSKFSIRPLAGLIDILFVAPLFERLWIVELVLTMLLAIGCILILNVLRKNGFATGGMFLLCMCMLPLNMEATYWLAASVRISFSVFFIGLSLWLLERYLETKHIKFFAFYALNGFITVGFYEPAIAMYLIMSLFLLWEKGIRKHWYILIVLLLHIIAIGTYYLLNSASPEMTARGQVLDGGIIEHMSKMNEMLGYILKDLNIRSLLQGCSQGLYILSSGKMIIEWVSVVLCSILFAVCSYRIVCKQSGFSWKRIVVGLCFCVAAMSVFYVLADLRFTIRSAYFVFIGIGVVFEELLNIITYRVRRVIIFILTAVLSFVFTVSGIGIVDKYQEVSKKDVDIAKQILKLDNEDFVTSPDKNSYLFGAVTYYKNIPTVGYYESIRGACSNYADITGCIRHIEDVSDTRNVLTVTDGGEIDLSVYVHEPQRCVTFALDGNENVIKVRLSERENGYDIFEENGKIYGTLENTEKDKFLFRRITS